MLARAVGVPVRAALRPAASNGQATFGRWTRDLVVMTDDCRRLCSVSATSEGVSMAFEVGKRVVAESESTDRRPRSGVVEEVVRGDPSPRYRIRWDDGHESIYTPASGALRAEQRPKRQRRAAPPNVHHRDTRRSTRAAGDQPPCAEPASRVGAAHTEADEIGWPLRSRRWVVGPPGRG
jgi:Domain of unknown function (DUF1918)